MEEKDKKRIFFSALFILVSISVYSILGIIIYTNSTAIYDQFPEKFYCDSIASESMLQFRVDNTSPLTLPLLNPTYSLRINVESDSEDFVYFKGYGNINQNFSDSNIAIGVINSGDYREITTYLHPDQGNLTMKINVYLNFWINILAASKSYSVEPIGNNEYSIIEIR